jgi:hypothetical protein
MMPELEFHPTFPAIIWVLSSVIGILVRLSLFAKFRIDLFSTEDPEVKFIAQRCLRQTVLHMVMFVGMIVLASWSMIVQQTTPPSQQPTAFGLFTTLFLTAIPIALTLDGAQEYYHQNQLVAYGKRVRRRQAALRHKEREMTDAS